LWNVENEAQEKVYSEVMQLGGIDSGDEILQVLADACERKVGEGGEESTCQWRNTDLSGWRSKPNAEGFEFGKCD
jgi:hypothetical protein